MSTGNANSFLHGVETIEVAGSVGNVSTVKTAVIALIGDAAKGPINELVLCKSESDDSQFGTTGSIPEALAIIRSQYSSAFVFVVSLGTGTPTLTPANFQGAVDPTSGNRNGMMLFDTCFSVYGFNPKIFIAPRYSSTSGITNLLQSYAATYRGAAYIDCPLGMTVANAMLSRGNTGIWNFTDYRTKLLFPNILDASGVQRPFSAYAAGLRAQIDNDSTKGFWFSSSNNTLSNINGVDTVMTSSLNNSNCDSNNLNSIGITTIFNGSGFREWGNRNSAFPANSDPKTFEAIQRLDDITAESIELAMLPYIDKPMTPAQIDLVTETVNAYFRTLISRGALIQGSRCYFDPTKNTTAQMADGQYIWTKDFMGAVPGERLTFYDVIDTSLLSNLLPSS
jgi:hypothetical protein